MKQQISGRQFFMVLYSYVLANDIFRGIYVYTLKNDVWIPELIGILGSVMIFTGYLLIYRNNCYNSFTDAIENILGKHLCKVIYTIYPLYFIIDTIFNLRDMIELVRIFLIENMPAFIICAIVVAVAFYVIIHGIEVMARLFTLFFYVFVFLFIAMATTNLIINPLHLSYILPILENGVEPIITPALKMSYSVPFGELFVMLIIFQFVKDKKQKQKTALYSILVSGFGLLMITFLGLIILGPEAMLSGLNPSINLAALIDIKNFLQRLDIILINILGYHNFVKITILMFGAQFLLNHTFKPKTTWISLLAVCTLVFIGITFFTKDYPVVMAMREKIIIPYVNLFFEVIIPAILILLSFLRKSKAKENVSEFEI